ncbi:MAG TPA: proline reductase-associated electron transfer protein PrdC, partial [Candidatus Mediterraneibacter gallistercoris]|nr:proline reductase-associated electron transfer protein PrdC [Candidatus Mediterraneibacter gallistercoris]
MKRIFRFPLKQNIGAKAAPKVVEGDKIVRGQLIASVGESELGANLFSSVSGSVTGIDENEIRVQADEVQPAEYRKLSGSNPLELIREAGIVGLGGAGFPAYYKLKAPFKTDGIVIVNAAECEPILGHNIAAIEKNPQKLIRGLQIVMDIVHSSKGVVAIKEVHTQAGEKLRETLEDDRIRIALLPDMYPMGEERAVIREVTGTLLGVDTLPLDADAIVVNAETACRIEEAVDLKKPLIDKDMTVAGKLRGNTDLIRIFENVPIGMSVRDVFDMAG